jgi:hypothetical protein
MYNTLSLLGKCLMHEWINQTVTHINKTVIMNNLFHYLNLLYFMENSGVGRTLLLVKYKIYPWKSLRFFIIEINFWIKILTQKDSDM